jgi:pimeloyl-ACP methyl ester carboxylesterase
MKPLCEAGFDLIVPSLPGYGFSEAPTRAGFGPVSMALAMDKLMHQLGYSAYVAQGGDWGSAVCRALGQLATLGEISGPKAIHTNLPGAITPPPDVEAELAKSYTEHDKQGLAARSEYNLNDSGYSKIQGTKPQTIGAALNDSPAGLLGWIVEKLHRWADNGGDPEKCFSKMDMITNVAMYWYSGTATSSARLYYEGSFGGNEKRLSDLAVKAAATVITVPFGFASFPKEIFWSPRSWLERSYTDIRRHELMPRGGHFAAWEQPDLMCGEISAFFLQDVDSRALCGVARSRL